MPPRAVASLAPPKLNGVAAGRNRRALAQVFGLRNFGLNLTRLPRGSASAQRHRWATEDELVYVLDSDPPLVTTRRGQRSRLGMCAGCAALGVPQQSLNRSVVLVLEIGDRTAGDEVSSRPDDLHAKLTVDGSRRFRRKHGSRD